MNYIADPLNNIASLKMATGYLNIQKQIQALLNQSGMPSCDIITSSPQANSFYQAGRVKKHIPALYRLNAIELLKSNRH